MYPAPLSLFYRNLQRVLPVFRLFSHAAGVGCE
jgi:hypothetical protein